MHSCLLSEERKPVVSLILMICKCALDFRTYQSFLYNQVFSFQQNVKSQLEPSLEAFHVTTKRDFLRCVTVIGQYQELLTKFTQLIKQHKLTHLNPLTKISKLHL